MSSFLSILNVLSFQTASDSLATEHESTLSGSEAASTVGSVRGRVEEDQAPDRARAHQSSAARSKDYRFELRPPPPPLLLTHFGQSSGSQPAAATIQHRSLSPSSISGNNDFRLQKSTSGSPPIMTYSKPPRSGVHSFTPSPVGSHEGVRFFAADQTKVPTIDRQHRTYFLKSGSPIDIRKVGHGANDVMHVKEPNTSSDIWNTSGHVV